MGKLTALIATVFLISIICAQVSVQLPPWNWSAYSGTSNWNVTVTEDDTGCQGDVFTTHDTITINHNMSGAVMGDVGHGTARGAFISDNILHMPARTVDDPPGKSDLSEYDVFFTTDCSAFAAKYTWDYSGPDGACSGSTSISGTNDKGCPELLIGKCRTGLDCNSTSRCDNGVCVPTQTQGVCTSDSDCNSGDVCQSGACVSSNSSIIPPSPLDTELASARKQLDGDMKARAELDSLYREYMRSLGYHPPNTAEADHYDVVRNDFPALIRQKQDEVNQAEAGIESDYLDILNKDPNNFWANWDMALLRKGQGNGAVAEGYLDTALGNLPPEVHDQIKANVQTSLHLENPPAPGSKIVQSAGNEATEIKSVAGIDMSKLTQQERDRVTLGLTVIALFDRNGDVLNSLNIKTK